MATNDCYSPYTGEHIVTNNPAPWMGRAGIDAPLYDPVSQGCFWHGQAWEVVDVQPDPGPVPKECTGRQGQKALLRTPYSGGGNMLDAVEALIAAIPDDFARQDAELDFNAAIWERSNPTLQAMWVQLGGTEAQLDDLFRLAATL